MANEEHLKILKQGVDVWNQWRRENPTIIPDLSDAILIGANLSWSYLRGVNFNKAYLTGTLFIEADLSEANLSWAHLEKAYIRGANLIMADLTGASLAGVNIEYSSIGWTIFASVDLSDVEGLDTVDHLGPSSIGIDTIYMSQGKIPIDFLRGAGVPEKLIDNIPSLIEDLALFHSCFISYSTRDQEFADRLYADLQADSVRCWFAPEDIKIGDRIRPVIDQAIREHEKMLLILSEYSIDSDWVEDEVEAAFERERNLKETVLFPIRLDSSIWDTERAWAAKIRRQRHIGDFSNWKDHDSYKAAFDRLLSDPKAGE